MACELESLRTHPSTTSMSALVREYPGFAWEVDPLMVSSPQLQEHTGIDLVIDVTTFFGREYPKLYFWEPYKRALSFLILLQLSLYHSSLLVYIPSCLWYSSIASQLSTERLPPMGSDCCAVLWRGHTHCASSIALLIRTFFMSEVSSSSQLNPGAKTCCIYLLRWLY